MKSTMTSSNRHSGDSTTRSSAVGKVEKAHVAATGEELLTFPLAAATKESDTDDKRHPHNESTQE